jgi:hypothetical protein
MPRVDVKLRDLPINPGKDGDHSALYYFVNQELLPFLRRIREILIRSESAGDTATIAADYEVTTSDGYLRVDAALGTVLVYLLGWETAADDVRTLYVKKIDSTANIVRIVAQSGELVEGAQWVDVTSPGEALTLKVYPGGYDIV